MGAGSTDEDSGSPSFLRRMLVGHKEYVMPPLRPINPNGLQRRTLERADETETA